jgi:tRNA pseudouridine38-40 synthase
MADAAARLVGTHDCAAFQSAGSDPATTVRTIAASRISVHAMTADPFDPVGEEPAWDGSWIVYRIEGTGFLRHMVRAIVGTLVEVGSGRAAPTIVSELLAGASRRAAGPTAPPQGLCLRAVSYLPPA